MEVGSSFKCLGSCFREDVGEQYEVRMIVGGRSKVLDSMKKIYNIRNLSLNLKRKFCDEWWGMREY